MPTRMVPLTEIKGVMQVQETDTKAADYLKVIRLEFVNPGTQTRAEINKHRVEYLARHFKDLKEIVLYDDGQYKWPGDGHHRICSALFTVTCPVCDRFYLDVAKHLKEKDDKPHKEYAGPEPLPGYDKILADVRPGGEREALKFSLTSNADHDKGGMPRSEKDLATSITIMVTDPEWMTWPNTQIAKFLQIPLRTVQRYAHLRTVSQDSSEPRTVTRGGKTYVMKTGKIGQKKRKSADEKLAEMGATEALETIKTAEEVCTCTCTACKKCKNKHKKA